MSVDRISGSPDPFRRSKSATGGSNSFVSETSVNVYPYLEHQPLSPIRETGGILPLLLSGKRIPTILLLFSIIYISQIGHGRVSFVI